MTTNHSWIFHCYTKSDGDLRFKSILLYKHFKNYRSVVAYTLHIHWMRAYPINLGNVNLFTKLYNFCYPCHIRPIAVSVFEHRPGRRSAHS